MGIGAKDCVDARRTEQAYRFYFFFVVEMAIGKWTVSKKISQISSIIGPCGTSGVFTQLGWVHVSLYHSGPYLFELTILSYGSEVWTFDRTVRSSSSFNLMLTAFLAKQK